MALLDPVRQLGLSKGLFGRSRFWLVVGALAWGIRGVSWANRSRERTIFRQVVEAGDTLLISATGPPPTRWEHRRSLKAERKLARRELRGKVATARMRRRHRVL